MSRIHSRRASGTAWHQLCLAATNDGYELKIEGVSVAEVAGPTLLHVWAVAGTSTLELGNLDGWIDEVVIKRL